MKNPFRWMAVLLGIGGLAHVSAAPQAVSPEQAVIVRFDYGSTDLGPLFKLEKELETAISAEAVGEYDGNEIAADGSDGILFMYGPDADRLFEVVEPILKSAQFMDGATVMKRYGPPEDGVREATVVIEP